MLRRLLGPALLALMATTVLAAVVSAHDGSGGPGGGGPGGGGGGATISAINGTQLTLVTADGWTRTLDASGVTVMSGTTTIAASDLKVGDEIAIRQSRNFDGTNQVVEIDVVAPHVEGTVTAVNTGSLTIQTAAGATTTVTMTATTTYAANRASATLADVTVGSVVRVQGTANADGSFTATSVSVHPASLGGTVTAATADSITVADASGATATIHVSAATTYRTAAGSGTLADAVVGSILRAEGVRNADGSLNATAVRIGTADGGFGGNRGGGHRGFGGPDGAVPTSPSANPSANPSASPSA
jgi:hypothetical protein